MRDIGHLYDSDSNDENENDILSDSHFESSNQSISKETDRAKRYNERYQKQTAAQPQGVDAGTDEKESTLTAENIETAKDILMNQLDSMESGKFNIKNFKDLMDDKQHSDLQSAWYDVCQLLSDTHTQRLKKKWFFKRHGNGYRLKWREDEKVDVDGEQDGVESVNGNTSGIVNVIERNGNDEPLQPTEEKQDEQNGDDQNASNRNGNQESIINHGSG